MMQICLIFQWLPFNLICLALRSDGGTEISGQINHSLLEQTHTIQPSSLALALAIVQARARNSYRLSELSGSSCRKSCIPLIPGVSASWRYVIWYLVPGAVMTRARASSITSTFNFGSLSIVSHSCGKPRRPAEANRSPVLSSRESHRPKKSKTGATRWRQRRCC